ncbi:class I SAM-dependent methyltransferase [Dinoroseobacter sp. S375]|uniref:class I SAM-dependent methyltransferase n=1 Tax=Dinoroseobacter sp. S375 TaxID=3415136 RepID=UPI003C7B4B1D
MGKRSDFPRRKHDTYDTPREAVEPLRGHLPRRAPYWEPCAGSGALIRALSFGNCVACSDIEPRGLDGWMQRADALSVGQKSVAMAEADYIITNPPWTRQILHPMIDHFAHLRPTWLLFDADWMHTKQAAPYLKMCRKIVSVGRVSWMQNGQTGKDNCAWYLFDAYDTGPARFFGRAAQ